MAILTILLPGADAADAVCRLKALLDWSCLLPDVDGFDGEGKDTDEMEASDRRFAAADNTGILLLLRLFVVVVVDADRRREQPTQLN